jgi:carbon storage regulator
VNPARLAKGRYAASQPTALCITLCGLPVAGRKSTAIRRDRVPFCAESGQLLGNSASYGAYGVCVDDTVRLNPDRDAHARRRCVLVLTRKTGESLWIGDEVEVRIVSVRGQKVRVAIEAPADVPVRRSELTEPGPRAPAEHQANAPVASPRDCEPRKIAG